MKPKLQSFTLLGRRLFSDVPLQVEDLTSKYSSGESRRPLVNMLKQIEQPIKTGLIPWADFYWVEGKMTAKPRPMRRRKKESA